MPRSWGGIEKRAKQVRVSRPSRAENKILSASLCIALGLCGWATSRGWFREDFHAKARRRQDDWQKAAKQVRVNRPSRAENKILSASLCVALSLCVLAASRDWFKEDFHAKARRRQDDWQKAAKQVRVSRPSRAENKILSASLCVALGLCVWATSRDWFREDFHAKARRRQDDCQKGIDWQVGAAKPACRGRGEELKKGAKHAGG